MSERAIREWRIAQRHEARKAFGLVAPLLFLLFAVFVAPIVVVLIQSVQNSEVSEAFPRTVRAIGHWDPAELPDESVYCALVTDLGVLRKGADKAILGRAAKRLNYELPTFRALLFSSAEQVDTSEGQQCKSRLIKIDSRWGDVRYWAGIRRNISRYTDFYILSVLDLQRDLKGRIRRVPADQAIFLMVFARTLWVAAIITVFSLCLGYPIAYLLATLPTRTSNILMYLVLLPFWTSALVRTTAWLVLLQGNGIVNQVLIATGLVRRPLELIFNRTGVIIAMTQVLLPFMILPIFGVMKSIHPQYVKAAMSLGANPLIAFIRVYVPQTLPGVGAGCAIVMISALGFYITPAIVGGPHDHMVSTFIADYINVLLSWGHAAALAVILLILIVCVYCAFYRVIGERRLAGR